MQFLSGCYFKSFPRVVYAYAMTSINIQLGQCYDAIIIDIYAALYSLQSTSAFIILFDIIPSYKEIRCA